MNFLNEIAQHHPTAISFASGRPAERFFRPHEWASASSRYLTRYGRQFGLDLNAAARRLAQYGPTAGIAREEVAAQLRTDHRIPCEAERLVITAGCQEAIALCILSLCTSSDRILLVRNPTYIGATGVADAAGIPIVPVDQREDESLDAALLRTIDTLAMHGLRAGAFYIIPDFDNPTGEVIPLDVRKRLLDLCALHRIVTLEDNPYGMFRFEGTPIPSMAELDNHGCVIHLGTFSKTLFPSVRVGSASFPETLFGDAAASANLLQNVVRRKSFLTVNTSQYCQTLVAGLLEQYGFTLSDYVKAPVAFYRTNRDTMIEALQKGFRGTEDQVLWNHPEGGFFLTLKLPFTFGDAELTTCATSYGTLVMPMRYFAIDDSFRSTVRLAFSNLEPESIQEGVRRFCAFTMKKIRETVR